MNKDKLEKAKEELSEKDCTCGQLTRRTIFEMGPEPEEMLMLERKKVQEMYQENLIEQHSDYHIQIGVLHELFGDKCLPDDSNVDTLANNVDSSDSNVASNIASKLPFKEGDIVRVITGHYKGKICEIYAVDESDDIVPYQSSLRDNEDCPVWLSDSDLEPYTDPSIAIYRNQRQIAINPKTTN